MLYESKKEINIIKMSHIVLPPLFALKYLFIWGLNQAGRGKKKDNKLPSLGMMDKQD